MRPTVKRARRRWRTGGRYCRLVIMLFAETVMWLTVKSAGRRILAPGIVLLQKPWCGPQWLECLSLPGLVSARLSSLQLRWGVLALIRNLTRQSVSRSSNLGASRCFHTSLLDHRGCTGALNLPRGCNGPARVLAALDDDVRTIPGPRMTEILLRWLVTLLQEVAPTMRDQRNASCRARKASLLNSDDLNDWQKELAWRRCSKPRDADLLAVVYRGGKSVVGPAIWPIQSSFRCGSLPFPWRVLSNISHGTPRFPS
jgi:hypothetical protein